MTSVPQSALRLRELAQSTACAAAIRAAVRLGVPEALGEDPSTVDDLATAVQADPGALRRLLRALTCYEVFAERPDGRFAHTAVSRMLREDAQPSLKYNVLWATEAWAWELWPRLDEAVRTGRTVFATLHDGRDFFEHLHADMPEAAEIFDRAMTDSSRLSCEAIVDALNLSDVDTIVDIGGGRGHVLAALLERYPALDGVLYDLPDVVRTADERLRPGGSLAGRARLRAGDCRVEVPGGADMYILKNILEWEDDNTVRTLRNVAEAAPAGARVVVVENLIDGSPEMKFTTAMDLLLLLNVGGKKHTRDGLLGLIAESGLEVKEVRPVNSYLHVFESSVPMR